MLTSTMITVAMAFTSGFNPNRARENTTSGSVIEPGPEVAAVAKLQELKVASLFAVIAVLALIGLSLYALIGIARRALIPWHAVVSPGAFVRPSQGASEAG